MLGRPSVWGRWRPKRRKAKGSVKSCLIATALVIMERSRHWPTRRAKKVCNFNKEKILWQKILEVAAADQAGAVLVVRVADRVDAGRRANRPTRRPKERKPTHSERKWLITTDRPQ